MQNRQLESKGARIAGLEKSLTALHAKDEARDTQSAAIEALLTRDAGKTATVSLTTQVSASVRSAAMPLRLAVFASI